MVQWLRPHTPNAEGTGFNPWSGNRSHMPHLRVHMPQLQIQLATVKIPDVAKQLWHSKIKKILIKNFKNLQKSEWYDFVVVLLVFAKFQFHIIKDSHKAVRNNIERSLLLFTQFPLKIAFAKLQYNITTRILKTIQPVIFLVRALTLSIKPQTLMI